MITADTITEEQIEKYKNFFKFYTDTMLDLYSSSLSKRRDKVKNEVYYDSYFKIVNKTANLMKELNISDPFSATVIFEYLLWNGYLSKNKKLIYGISGRINNIVLTGADIMLGKSVCLNNADMLSDVLNAMGFESYIMGCSFVENVKVSFEYKPNIERKRESKVVFGDKLLAKFVSVTPLKKIGNHAVVLFKFKDRYFMGDPTNLAFLNFVDFLKGEYIGSDLQLDLKPWQMLILDGIEAEKFKEIIVKTFFLSDEQVVDLDMVRNVSNYSLNLCKKNLSLLNDFHDDNIKDINIVCKTLKKIK